jgi:D-alanyl-lipoteichoic acid acyltransferase DltB (MBOAT superfamily)
MPQFANEASYRFKADNLSVGLTLFALGLCKKVLFADSIAPWAEAGFDHPLGLDMLNAWSVVLAYSMQLYFDFSGYSDMAIGIGIMFGIKLPLNFNSPYKSASIIDFWQRWHMTLTRYITLLLYNPIALWVVRLRTRSGASTGKKAAATPAGFASMIAFPTITTMLLAGIWHGAGFQYVVFGLLHGLYLTINHAWRIFRATPSKAALRPVSLVWRVALTYLAVLLAQVFFRAHSASDAMAIIAGMIGLHGSGLPVTIPLANAQHFGAVLQPLIDMNLLVVGLRETYNALTLPLAHNLALAIALLVIAFTTPNVYQMLGDWSPAYTKVKAMSGKLLLWRPAWPVAIGFGVLLFFLSLRFGSSARFLYFQF